MLVPVGLSEAQVATPDGSNLDAFILPVSPNSQSDDIVMLNVTAYGNINPLTFSWSQTYNGSPIVRLQNADSSLTSFRIPYATSGQDATLSFEARVNDGPYHIIRTIDVPVTLTVKPPIVVLPREPVPGVAETILFEQQWGDTDRWILDDQWSIASPTDILPVDTNNRVINIGACDGSCPLQLTDKVELSTYHGADLVFWVWFGDQTASTDSLNIEVAMAQDGVADSWENTHTIIVGQSTHQQWFPVTVNLDEFAGDDFFLRFTPSLDGDKGTIQIDAVQLIAKTNDNVKPVLSNIPQDIIRDTLGPSVVTFVKPIAVDDVDGPVTVECDTPSGIIYPFDTVTVTCKSEDSAGNIASASFDVTLNLFISLEITAPDDLVLEAIGELTPVSLGDATITKAATITNDAPDLFPLGNTTVTWTAQDDRDTANDTQIITIQDTTDPVITPPGDITLEATSIISMIKLGVATATDTVDPMPTITSDAPNSFPIGTTRITYTATDDSGNSATATQEITINDAEPMLILPSDVIAEATGVQTPVDIGTATVTDNIDEITATNNATDSFPLGETMVKWTAKDSSGNTVTAVQKITVQDTTNPYFDAPESYNVFAEATGIFTSVEINTVTVHDIADPDVTVTNDAPDSFPTGATFVTWTARDSSGNTAQYNQVVVVSDRTSPTITAPDDVTIEADGLLTMIQLGVATATDLVDTAPRITSDAPTSFPIGVTIITYTAADDAGNSAIDTQKVTVRDTTEPLLILPLDVTAEATGVLTMLDIGTARVTDNVDSITATNDAPDSFQVGETRVTWTAKDNADNEVTAVQTVIIRDTTKPAITVPDSIIAEATDRLTPVDIGSATASDIADSDVTITNNSPGSFPLGSTVIEWTATDDSDNVTNDTQTVRIQDTTKPVFTSFPEDITVTFLNRGTVEFETPTATDIFPVTILCDYDSGDSFSVGSTLVTCMTTDANDNSARDSFSVIVMPPIVPPVAEPIDDLTASEITANSLTLSWTQPKLNNGTLQTYRLVMTTPHGDPQTFVGLTAEPFYEVTGLTSGTDYSFRVQARTDGGFSSNNTILDTTTLVLPPKPINDLTASNITSNSLRLEWTQPDLNGGTLQEYRLMSTSPHGDPATQLALTTERFYDVTGLEPGTQYSFSVEALNEAGYGDQSNIVDIATLPSLDPEPVDNVSVRVTHNSAFLDWEYPVFNGHQIRYFIIMGIFEGENVIYGFYHSPNETFMAINDLEPETEYTFRVDVHYRPNFDIEGIPFTFTTLPEPIDDLTASAITPNSLTLSWTQPMLDDSILQTYHILSTSPHGTPTIILANTTNTSYAVSDLIPNTAYSFSVITTTNQGGTSESSNIVDIRAMFYAPPEPINDLTASNITSNSLRLEWTQPDLNNGTLQEYRLVSTSPHGDPTVQLALTTEPFFEITDLIYDTDYSFQVQARTEGGYSDGGIILDTRTSPLPPPDPILDLRAYLITADSLRLHWTQPDLNNGTLQEYRLMSTSPHGNPTTQLALTTERFYDVTGLEPGTQYSFSVETRNEAGFGDQSNIVDIETGLPPDPVDDLLVTNITHNSLELQWDAPNVYDSWFTYYSVILIIDEREYFPVSEFDITSANLKNLYPDTTYSMRVDVYTDFGMSMGAPVIITTLPEPVDDLSATDITSNSLTLSWTTPLYSDNSLPPYYHILSASPHGTPAIVLVNTTNPSDIISDPATNLPPSYVVSYPAPNLPFTYVISYPVTNLTPDTDYSFSVRGVTDEGVVSVSNNIIDTRTLPKPLPPDPVLDLSATDITSNSLRLEWTQPDLNGGTFKNYLVNFTTPHDTPTTFLGNITTNSSTHTGLTPDTEYSYSVKTVTVEGGASESSNILDATTLLATTLLARPEPVLDLKVSNITSNSLRLEWTQPDLNGGTLQEYRLSSTSPHGNSTTQLALTTEPFYFVIDLQPDTQYSFSVEASNEAGFGQPSNIVDIVTLELPPPDPVDDLRASDITHNSVRLKWSEPNLNGAEISNYAISVYPDDGRILRYFTSSTYPLIGNLEPDTEYNILVTMRSNNGDVDGNIITFTTLPRPVDDLTVSEITTESLTLSWTQPVFNNSTLQTYHILSASPHGTPTVILANTTNTSYTVSDLMPYVAYSFSVRTVTNQGATSESGNIINTRTLLIPPESGKDLMVTNITSNSIRLEWTQLDLNNGTLLEYRLLSTSPHSDPATQLALTTEPFYEVTDLTPNTDYSFRVQAITEDGYSVDSTILDTATLPLDTTNPVFTSFPDDITVKSKNSVSIEFASPTATDLYPVTILCSHNSGDLFSIGSTLVTCTATDTSDNSVQDSFIVTVNVVTGFETITDDFANLDSWEVYDRVATWARNDSRGFNNYTVAVTATDGNPAPSVLITGNGEITYVGIHRYFSLENHDSNDPLYVSIDYNVSSDGGAYADIVYFTIFNTDGKRLFTDRLSPSPHYTIGSGWDTRNIDISQYVSGQDDIEVRLYHWDIPSTDLHQVVSFDNFYLGTNPPPSRSISGEADIQLTPPQEPLQISQYHQTQICELIELQDESSDLYYYMLDLIRAYNMTATC